MISTLKSLIVFHLFLKLDAVKSENDNDSDVFMNQLCIGIHGPICFGFMSDDAIFQISLWKSVTKTEIF